MCRTLASDELVKKAKETLEIAKQQLAEAEKNDELDDSLKRLFKIN